MKSGMMVGFVSVLLLGSVFAGLVGTSNVAAHLPPTPTEYFITTTAMEISGAVDPNNPNNMIASHNYGTSYVSYSHDGGMTWYASSGPFSTYFRGDPQSAFDTNGNAYYSHMQMMQIGGNWRWAEAVFKSTDAGVTFTDLGVIAQPGTPVHYANGDLGAISFDVQAAVDYEKMACDVRSSSFRDNLYIIYDATVDTDGDTLWERGEEVLQRSTDGGQTWSEPLCISSTSMTGTFYGSAAETIGIGADGAVYIAIRPGLGSIYVTKSTDGGVTFTTPQLAVQGSSSFWCAHKPIFCDPSHANILYIALSAYLVAGDPSTADVYLTKSTDYGATWSTPVMINDNPGDGSKQTQVTGSISAGGRIDLMWWDFRNSPNPSGTPIKEYADIYYAYSTDGGATFSSSIRLTPQCSKTFINPGNDYGTVVSLSDRAIVFYAYPYPNVDSTLLSDFRAVATQIVFYPNQPPQAWLEGPTSGTAGNPVTFYGDVSYDSDGSIVEHLWAFGDGSTKSGTGPPTTVEHIYASTGTYTATLQVKDDDGAWSVVDQFSRLTLTITTPPVSKVLFFDDFTDGNTVGWTLVQTGGKVTTTSPTSGIGCLNAPSMSLARTKSNGATSATHSFTKFTDGRVIVDMKVMTNTISKSKYSIVQVSSGTSPQVYFGLIQGAMSTYSGSKWVSIGTTYKANIWYQITFDINLASSVVKYDIYVNGILAKAQVPLYGSAPHAVDNVVFKAGDASQNGVTLWVDEVSVKRGGIAFFDTFSDNNISDWVSAGIGTVTLDSTMYDSMAPSMMMVDNAADPGGVMRERYLSNLAGTVVVEAKMRCSDNSNSANRLDVFGQGYGGSVDACAIWFSELGDIYYMFYDATGTHWGRIMPYNSLQWYDVSFVISLATYKYDLYIDGVLRVAGAGIYPLYNVNWISFASMASPTGTQTMWVDDVMVYNS